jgi:hypothetical protein
MKKKTNYEEIGMSELIDNNLRVAKRTKLFLLVMLLAFTVAGCTAFILSSSSSEGQRSGVLMKYSNKGIIAKTNEGTLAMAYGVTFNFSVTDIAVDVALKQYIGKPCILYYKEAIMINPFKQETHYTVIKVVPDLSGKSIFTEPPIDYQQLQNL